MYAGATPPGTQPSCSVVHAPLLAALHPQLAGLGAAQHARTRGAQVPALRMQAGAHTHLPRVRQHQHAVPGALHLCGSKHRVGMQHDRFELVLLA